MTWRDEPGGWLNWALPCGRIAGIDISIHWTLLLLSAFHAFGAIREGLPWWWLPLLLLVPPVSVLLHEFGHAGAARLAGGSCERIVLWMLGGAAMCSAPPRAWPQFAVAAAGPLVSLLLAGAALLGATALAGHLVTDLGSAYHAAGVPGALLAFVFVTNLWLLLFNLLPCYPLDGGRMARAALWPVAGRRRAVRWTLWLAYACIVLGLVWAMWSQSLMLLVLVIFLLMSVVREHQMMRQGYDPEFGDYEIYERGSAFDRWRARRAAAAAERDERHAAAEQAELDRLLAKVSAGGLPSLSESERRMLRRISERERQKRG